ncbi:hypothetical protein HA402_000786 [Bradysia odoriphaga]|nr:hypothetical protein HA402_000786 [Bradysia odoriphaga]
MLHSLFTNRRLTSQRVLFVPVGLLFSATAVNLQSCPASTVKMENPADYKSAESIYDFTVKDTFGNDVKLDKYKGHVVLIVNIASECGLRILSFPCSQFGSQMPEEDGKAMECHLKSAKAEFGDLFKKIDVNGDIITHRLCSNI